MSAQLSPGDFPANPLEKPGYRLDFHDEFDQGQLDTTKWLVAYLPQWSSRHQSAPQYRLQGSTLVLQIIEGQQPWCPEFDGEVRASSIQTGVYAGPLDSPFGQHHFSQALRVREAQETAKLYTPRYGYFEVRAKGVNTPGNHVSLWMIGFEDAPEKSAEIAVMEIFGAYVSATQSRVGYGVHPWYDPAIRDEFYEEFLPIDATQFHIYAAEWTPSHIDFYVDNQKIRTIHQSPTYELQFMLSIFEVPTPSAQTQSSSYPKEFTVDYIRAYQPVGGYPASEGTP